MKPNQFIYLNSTDELFFRRWMEFLTPFHHMTAREREVAARILMQFFKFKDNVQDPDVLLELLWSKKSKNDMMSSLKMTPQNFQMFIGKLRNRGFLRGEDNEIHPKLIPHRIKGDTKFVLQIVYDWSSEENPVRNDASDKD